MRDFGRAGANNCLTICAITLDIYKQKGSGNVKIGKEFTKGQGCKVAGRLPVALKIAEVVAGGVFHGQADAVGGGADGVRGDGAAGHEQDDQQQRFAPAEGRPQGRGHEQEHGPVDADFARGVQARVDVRQTDEADDADEREEGADDDGEKGEEL